MHSSLWRCMADCARGSALLAIAVLRGEVERKTLVRAEIHEDFQIGRWGEDREATERRAHRWRDFAAAADARTLAKLTCMNGARSTIVG